LVVNLNVATIDIKFLGIDNRDGYHYIVFIGIESRKGGKMDEIRPTWRLAWGLWWRMFLISLGISVIIGLIMFLLGISLIMPWISSFGIT